MVEQESLDSPPGQRMGFHIDFDDEKHFESFGSFDDSDGVLKKKVKMAKPVEGFSDGMETIGELTMSRQRPANYSRSENGQDSLMDNVEPSSVSYAKSSKSPTSLAIEIKVLEAKVETFKEQRWKGPPVEETVRRLLWGKPCALDFYKSKEDKKSLLEAALNTLDGNCITKVLLFIRSTSRIGILVKIVEDKPVAINHFASYLRQNQEFEELIRFYEMVGDKEAAGMLMYERCQRNRTQFAVQQLDECEMFFKRYPELSPNVPILQDNVKLLKKQLSIHRTPVPLDIQIKESVLFHSLITTLFYCCRYFYNDNGATSPCNPRFLKTDFKLSDQQYMFMAIKACASRREWKAIEELLTVKGVFGSKLKSPIGFKNVVRLVSKHNAPDEVKTKYLNEVSDIEDRLKLAMDHKVHSVAINLLFQLKDQKRLESYISRVPPTSQYRQMIQDKLRILTQRK